MIFEEIGKSTFVFRVEIPRDKINDAVEDAFERFETTHESYKIRVFKTSENLKRAGTVVEAHFLTIKVEAVNVRISAYAMTPVLNYILPQMTSKLTLNPKPLRCSNLMKFWIAKEFSKSLCRRTKLVHSKSGVGYL